VKNKVTLANVLLDLNTNNLVLDSTATISGENESTRIIGLNGGEVIISLTLNNPQNANPGNLGAMITSPKNLGLVTIKRGHKEQTGSTVFDKSILRYYDILPFNNTQLSATVGFNYLDAELNGTKESTANLFKSTNNGAVWTNTNANTPDVNLNYIQKQSLASLATFTMANAATALSGKSETNNSAITKEAQANLKHPESKAWPLPANGPFNLQLNGETETTEALIYDDSGKLLQRLTLTPGAPSIITNLLPGIYFIKKSVMHP